MGERATKLLREFIEAVDAGAVKLTSPDIERPDGAHPWHEEWLHHARRAIHDGIGEALSALHEVVTNGQSNLATGEWTISKDVLQMAYDADVQVQRSDMRAPFEEDR